MLRFINNIDSKLTTAHIQQDKGTAIKPTVSITHYLHQFTYHNTVAITKIHFHDFFKIKNNVVTTIT